MSREGEGMNWMEAVTERDEVLDQIAKVHFGLTNWEQMSPAQLKEVEVLLREEGNIPAILITS